MWYAQKLELFKNQFNFTSSGQGIIYRTSLSIDDITVINQIEELEHSLNKENIFQFHVCEECGITHCKPGNWAAVRKSGNFILFIPAFAWIFKSEGDAGEYFPPYYLIKNGAIVFTPGKFEELTNLTPYFTAFQQFRHLTNIEALNLFKFEAPHNLFGALPEFTDLCPEKLIAASEGELSSMIDILMKKLKNIEVEKNDIYIEPVSKFDTMISFYLDNKDATEWKALYRDETGYSLLIGETFKLKIKSG